MAKHKQLLEEITLGQRARKQRKGIAGAASSADAAEEGAALAADTDDFANVNWNIFDVGEDTASSSSSSSSSSSVDKKKKNKKKSKQAKKKSKKSLAKSPAKAKAKTVASAKAEAARDAKRVAAQSRIRATAEKLLTKVQEAEDKLASLIGNTAILDIPERIIAKVKAALGTLREQKKQLQRVMSGQADPESGAVQIVADAVGAANAASKILKAQFKTLGAL